MSETVDLRLVLASALDTRRDRADDRRTKEIKKGDPRAALTKPSKTI